jgi:excinuclease ABC subunit C
VLESFLAQFYDDKEPPPLILVSHELEGAALLEEALAMKAGARVEIRRPERGEKREIIDQAIVNAREALGRRMAETASVAKLLDGVAETFGLTGAPERIEVYDNSHIQGTNAVGAMIVAGPEGFRKNQYRKFNIRPGALTPGDDYAMMRQVVTRRFEKLARDPKDDEPAPLIEGGDGGVDFSKQKEDDDKFSEWPDLVLIDGGEGQLNAARDALSALALPRPVALVGVAKGVDRDAGREQFFMPGRAPFRLDEKSPVLYYLQRLRDEAHRFAIGAHRQKRKADLTRNPLDEIGGVGPSRKKALLARFGSARGVARANVSELSQVDGINNELAQRIYDYFHT